MGTNYYDRFPWAAPVGLWTVCPKDKKCLRKICSCFHSSAAFAGAEAEIRKQIKAVLSSIHDCDNKVLGEKVESAFSALKTAFYEATKNRQMRSLESISRTSVAGGYLFFCIGSAGDGEDGPDSFLKAEKDIALVQASCDNATTVFFGSSCVKGQAGGARAAAMQGCREVIAVAAAIDNNVVYYYSGHGEEETGNWGFPDGLISVSDLKEIFAGFPSHNRKIIIIADCCYAGQWNRTIDADPDLRSYVQIFSAGEEEVPDNTFTKAFFDRNPYPTRKVLKSLKLDTLKAKTREWNKGSLPSSVTRKDDFVALLLDLQKEKCRRNDNAALSSKPRIGTEYLDDLGEDVFDIDWFVAGKENLLFDNPRTIDDTEIKDLKICPAEDAVPTAPDLPTALAVAVASPISAAASLPLAIAVITADLLEVDSTTAATGVTVADTVPGTVPDTVAVPAAISATRVPCCVTAVVQAAVRAPAASASEKFNAWSSRYTTTKCNLLLRAILTAESRISGSDKEDLAELFGFARGNNAHRNLKGLPGKSENIKIKRWNAFVSSIKAACVSKDKRDKRTMLQLQRWGVDRLW
jgi:hypothetical protein